jgi:serine/alanine adding enzyme
MNAHQRLLNLSDENSWRSLLPASQSVFGSYEFAFMQEQYGHRIAKLFVCDDGRSKTFYPFFLRSLSELPFSQTAGANWDAATPEFTGPLYLSGGSAAKFCEAVHQLFCELGVVTEFMHLNPWSDAGQMLTGGELCFNREVVWVDTTRSEDELSRNHFSYACRKNLKRAANEGVRVFEATGLDEVRAFHRIYSKTMDRNQALSSYYFPIEYFTSIFEQMTGNARFVLAEYKGQIVAATLYMHDDVSVYSYLGGADYDHQQVRPTNAIVNYAIAWARRSGKRRLVLGGGYQPDDGIFRFKASFSRLRAKFYTFRRIHLRDQYDDLRAKWCMYHGADPDDNYFPSYRSTAAMGSLSAIGFNE